MVSVSTCPACDQSNWTNHLTCKDFTVSHETFSLQKCSACNLVVTNPRPDNAQLSKYYPSTGYISHSSKASSIIDSLYLFVRSFTLRWKLRLIDTYQLPSKTILDYGCGTGDFLFTCQKAGWAILGVEPSALARGKALERTGGPVLEELPRHQSKKFSVITLWHVLEHVPNPNNLLSTLASALDNDGTLFIAVPNYESDDANNYKENWAAYDVPRHLCHFSRENMKILLSKNGLQLKEVVPMKLDAFYVSMLSEKYKNHGRTNLVHLATAFFNGLRSNIRAKKTGAYSSLIYIAKK